MRLWCWHSGSVFCPPGRVSGVAGSAPPSSCLCLRLQHQRGKSCWKNTTAVALKPNTSSAGWPHMWLIESKPCVSLSSWWRSGALTRPTQSRCFFSHTCRSRPPSFPHCRSSSQAGSSSSSWMYVTGTTIAAYQRSVWHRAPPTSSKCLRASIAMATGDDRSWKS